MRFTRPRSDAAQRPPRWRRLPSHVSRHYPRRGAPDVPLQRNVQGRAARDAGPGGAERHRQGCAAAEEPVRRGARAPERGRGPALLPRDARAAHPRRLRPREPAARPGRRRRPVRGRRGARRGDAQDGAPGTAPGGLRHTHCRARCSRGRGPRASGCHRPAGDVAARGGAGVRAVAHRMRARRRGHRAGGRRAGVVQRGRWGRPLPALPANALPAPAAEPAAAPGVPRSPRPERLAGGAPRARSAACRGSPPPRRSICPLSPRRGRLTFRAGLLGASREGASPSHSHTDPLRRFVIGTAGHIDHGKTALVKALTGVDTDRWEEEKRRGITIDLGFAPLPLDDAIQASVVDVPGHEGFVRNMLAGATGIDVALLVIAADEGLMPQTEEHLAIVELLGVRRGIPVITKRDLADSEWLALVRSEVSTRLSASRVRWDESIATSVVTGEGLPELRAALRRVAGDLVERPADDLFRLPIDRVFAVAGAGTVVTGSTWSGSVAVGEAVRLLPLDREVRVRSIEVHGQADDRAGPGRRTALALVGVDKQELARGDVAVTGEGWAATTVLDAVVELLPAARKPVGSRTRVRVHLGTAEVLARAVQTRAIGPGEQGLARFILERPLVARGGDRFVLRSFSPVTTIGGGVVLDPYPPRRPGRLRQRQIAAAQSAAERLAAWVGEAGLAGLRARDLPVRLGIFPGDVSRVITDAGKGVLSSGEWLMARATLAAEVDRLAAVVEEHHHAHPLDPGMSLQALRSAVGGPGQQEVVDQVLDLGVRKRAWEIAGSVVRRPGWKPAADAGVSAALAQRLGAARWQIPTVAELEREFTGNPVRALLAHLARGGGVESVDQERYAATAALVEFRTALEAALGEGGSATPAQLKDRFGLTRKYLIPLLEWADRRGITRRKGDTRVLAIRLTAGREGA